MKLLTSIIICCFVLIGLGCSKSNVVTDAQGYQYKLVSKGGPTQDGDRVDVYQRVKPVDTNEFFTPSLQWILNTNETPSFVTLSK